MSILILFTIGLGLICRTESSAQGVESSSTDSCAALNQMFLKYISSSEYMGMCSASTRTDSEVAAISELISGHLDHVVADSDNIPGSDLNEMSRGLEELDTNGIELQMVVSTNSGAASDTGLIHRSEPVPVTDDGIAEDANMPMIPVDDYISLVASVKLKLIQNSVDSLWVQASQANWYEDLAEPVNLALYITLTNTRVMSTCRTEICGAWVELLAQLHYRVAIGFHERTWANYIDFTQFIEPSLRALQKPIVRINSVFQPRACIVAASVIVGAVVIPAAWDIGCCCVGMCMKAAHDAIRGQGEATAPVAPVPTEDPVAIELMKNLERARMQALSISGLRELNGLIIMLAQFEPTSADQLEGELRSVRIDFMVKLMSITISVVTHGSSDLVDKQALHDSTLKMTQLLEQQPDLTTWKQTKDEICKTASALLAILLPFV